ncbi:MAG: methyltransferase domain-containing protein [Opitutaceae bacterium]
MQTHKGDGSLRARGHCRRSEPASAASPPAHAPPGARAGTLAASFSRAAAAYRTHARVQDALADWLAGWLPADRSGAALELGAGPGLFSERLLPWKGRLLATDLSARMCAEGRARLPGIEWAEAAAEHPPAGPWNWIFASSMLQWLADPPAAFAAWRGALAPGGRVLAGLYVAGTLREWHEIAGPAAPVTWRSSGQWRAFLQAAGLRLLRDETAHRRFQHASARALLRSLHGIGAAPSRRIRPAALLRFLREYDRRHREADGVRSSWTFYRFEATRG